MPFQGQCAIAQGLEHPGAAKGRGFSPFSLRDGNTLVKDFPEMCWSFWDSQRRCLSLQHKQRSLPCAVRSTWNLGLSSKHTGGIHLQAQPSLYAWVFPQWILVKLYLEKLYFNICDGNSPLKNGFAITVVVLLKLPDCLPWQQGPACQWKVSWAR